MATEYTIVYTYTGQDNTSGARSVSANRFVISGDTGRTIGQITSIQYVHYHTSTGSMNWGLQGRLVLSDGTIFVSDQIYNHISGNIVGYINTFTNLPSAEQFAMLTSIQTLDTQGKTTSGGYSSKLYWRADNTHPMYLIVKFIEEPPVVYSPSITSFSIGRCNSNATLNDEGQYIATTIKLALGNPSGIDIAQCRIYYSANIYPEVGVSQYIDVTSRMTDLINGLNLNTEILSGVWELGYQWYFIVAFVVGEEVAVATASAPRGTTSFHISAEPGGGVCVGGFSSGTTKNPKFESVVPGYFYKGIDGITNYSDGEVLTGGTWVDGKQIYRSVLNFTTTLCGTGGVVVNLPSVPKTLISVQGWFCTTTSTIMCPIPFCQFNDIQYSVCVFMGTDGTGINMTFGSKWTGTKNGYIIVEYTKD